MGPIKIHTCECDAHRASYSVLSYPMLLMLSCTYILHPSPKTPSGARPRGPLPSTPPPNTFRRSPPWSTALHVAAAKGNEDAAIAIVGEYVRTWVVIDV